MKHSRPAVRSFHRLGWLAVFGFSVFAALANGACTAPSNDGDDDDNGAEGCVPECGAGEQCVGGRCRPCGAENEACCASICGGGLVCAAKQCVSATNACAADPSFCNCGLPEQQCCPGGGCKGGLVCGGAQCGCSLACDGGMVMANDGALWENFERMIYPDGSPLLAKAFAWAGYVPFEEFGCAIAVDGGVYCWGVNEHGLGGSDPIQVEAFSALRVVDTSGVPLASATDISVTQHSVCAVVDGQVFCWGESQHGHLGADAAESTPFATRVVADASGTPLSSVAHISVGHSDTCALRTDGSVWCWGQNNSGQVGVPTSTPAVAYPTELTALSGAVTSLSVLRPENTLDSTRCASLADGSVWCWGSNHATLGALGGGPLGVANSSVPVRVLTAENVPLTDVEKVVPWGNWAETCGLKRDGTLWCWGSADRPNLARQFFAGTMGRPLFAVGRACWISDNDVPMNTDGTRALPPGCSFRLE